MSVTGPALSIRDAAFSWGSGFSMEIDAFDLSAHERVLLLGPSGGGKSTFLNLAAGIVKPQRGRIDIMGAEASAVRPSHRDRFRAENFGIIFQMFNLLPWLSTLDNVLIPLRFSPLRRAKAKPPNTEAARLLSALGIEKALFDQPAGTLSVGQQQRVAAARALIGRPGIILADEPTSALDRQNAEGFLSLMLAELQDAGSALLMVSHDETLSGFFDRTIELEGIARVSRRKAA